MKGDHEERAKEKMKMAGETEQGDFSELSNREFFFRLSNFRLIVYIKARTRRSGKAEEIMNLGSGLLSKEKARKSMPKTWETGKHTPVKCRRPKGECETLLRQLYCTFA